MKQIEDILESAINELASGKTQDEVLTRFPEHQAELKPLLELAVLARSLPRNNPPLPDRQRKFLLQRAPSLKWGLGTWFKLASVPLVFVLVALGVETAHALPGTPLFSVKKAAEQTHIKLASKANQPLLEITLAEKRLGEARTVLAESDSPKQKTQALEELHEQTEKAIDSAAPVVTAKALNNDSAHLETLITLNKQVQSLASSAPSAGDAKTLADAAVTNKQKLAPLIATANEVALAPVLKSSDIIVKGTVKLAGDDSVSVSNLVFNLTDQTVIKSDDDTSNLSKDALVVNTAVNISGVKDKQGKFTATSVVILTGDTEKAAAAAAESNSGQVKGTLAPKDPSVPMKKVEPPTNAEPAPEEEPAPDNTPGTAVGNYIPEQPSDQPRP